MSSDAGVTSISFAILSNRSNCGFRHPRSSVLDSLRVVPGIEIYQTNRLSCTNMGAGGKVADANIADPETIESDGVVSVVVSGGNYVVSLSARGTSQTFAIN